MNKNRVEAFSDGVFSIVMTILILEIKLPHFHGDPSNQEMIQALRDLWPVLRSYVISFIILGMYWVAQHAYFHLFTRQVDRRTAWLNLLFLMQIVFVPFTAHLIGLYPHNQIAVMCYGINIIGIGLTLYGMLMYLVYNRHLMHEDVSPILLRHATIRLLSTPAFAVLGIIASFLHSNLSFFVFAFPIIFNIIPGTLDAADALYLEIKKKIKR